jgi:hypothetical protein
MVIAANVLAANDKKMKASIPNRSRKWVTRHFDFWVITDSIYLRIVPESQAPETGTY